MKNTLAIATFTVLLVGSIGVASFTTAKEQVGHATNIKVRCEMGEKKCEILETNAVALNQAMRTLWEDHVTWTRLYIVETLADHPGAATTAARLLENQVDIGDAMRPFYGEVAGNALTNLLTEHIVGAVVILDAAKAGDTGAYSDAVNAWYDNADEIAELLHNANPSSWPLEDMKMHMRHHLDLTIQEVAHQLAGEYAESVASYDEVHDQILVLADTLSEGIITQFPGKF